MKRWVVACVVAALGVFPSRADTPVVCGGVQMAPGTTTCAIDAKTVNQGQQIVLGFNVVNPSATVTVRVDVVDSKGVVRATTGTVSGQGITGNISTGPAVPPGVYSCKVTSSGAFVVVQFACTIS